MIKIKKDLVEDISLKIENEIVKPTDDLIIHAAFKEKCAAFWNITLSDKGGGLIYATSRMGDKFEGTIADFNRLLRG